MPSNNHRLIVLGLDGATFDVIYPMLKRGELPTIKKLMKEGSYGRLRSTKIPISPSAWSSFLTGLSPENHGIYDFVTRKEGTYEHIPVNSTHRRGIPVWQILEVADKKSIVMNVPATYPPEHINGAMISGFPVPPGKKFITPESFSEELREKFGEVNLQPEYFYSEGKEKEFLDDQHRCWDSTEKVFRYLWKEKDWDVFISVFKPTDEVMHGLWKSIDPGHPSHNKMNAKYGDGVLELYRKADRLIAEILEEKDSRTDLLIMSDHGFGPVHSTLYMNNWLIENGYMSYRRNPGVNFRKFIHSTGLNLENAFNIGKKFGLSGIGKKVAYSSNGTSIFKKLMNAFFLSYKDIDWENTKAYSAGNFGQIYINREGREPHGIVSGEEYEDLVDELIRKLRRFRDPRNGKIIFDRVLKRDEEYQGRFIDEAPDIVFFDRDFKYTTNRLFEFGSNKLVGKNVIDRSGDHKPYGIFFASGDKFEKGKKINGAKIIDIMPSILYSFGLPIPDNLDGRILEEIFTVEYRKNVEPEYVKYEELEKEKSETSEEDIEEMQRKLKGLGYA